MDLYFHEWAARLRRADLMHTADELTWHRAAGARGPGWSIRRLIRAAAARRGRFRDGRTVGPERAARTETTMEGRAERVARGGAGRALALALVLFVWSAGFPVRAWAHGGHPHGGVARLAPATADPLNARSARFDFDPPRPGSYRLPVVKPAADGAVIDASGAPRRLADVLAGRITVLSFVYTRCSDANGCPLATAVLYQLHGATGSDPELARHLRLVTLSFDPGHDTPETMAKYARVASTQETRSPWEFLTTASDRQLGPILAAYGQVVQRSADPSAPGPSHLLRVYLIDRQLRIRNIYGLDFLDPRLLLADVRTLLLESGEARR
jgi:cytochrome oxidase Cu insertion factor (SCO1/SenC/PrrC family)